jgi:protein TonB
MSYLINNQQKLNEIIFENRNKNYGAYVLRSTYGYTVFRSLSYMMLGFGSVVLTAYYYNHNNNKGPVESVSPVIIDTSTYTVEYKMFPDEPEKKTEAAKPAPSKPLSIEHSSNTTVVDSLAIEEVQNVNEDLAVNTPSTPGVEGSIDNSSVTISDVVGDESVKYAVVDAYLVDSGPEFEGGLKALYRFLGSNLRYPSRASDAGVEGTVYVKFVVDETGKVTRLSLLNNVGYGLDEEALRVVGMIPKFKTPAKVKGKAVKTYYQLPIRFAQK